MPENSVTTHPSLNLYKLFVWPYALYIVLNFFFMIERFGFEYISLVPVAFALVLMVKDSPAILFTAALSALLESLYFFPTTSNHLIVAFVLHAFLAVSFVVLSIKNRNCNVRREDYYELFGPCGRFLLLTMYFWATFHKINADFLNPEISYGTLLLKHFAFLPEQFVQHPFSQYAAIYGTLVLEGGIILLLAFKKTRYWGMSLGVVFHMLLSVNLYRNYICFSVLSFALHFFFLSPGCLERYKNSALGRFLEKPSRYLLKNALKLFFPLLMLAACGLLEFKQFIEVFKIAWIPVGLTICAFVLYYDWGVGFPKDNKNYLIAPVFSLNALAVFFFISCASPYIGLKNGQVISMFSNLKMEAGYSNHVLIRKPLYIFDNLRHPVKILHTTHPDLMPHQDKPYDLAAFVVEYHMARSPGAAIRYVQDNKVHDYPNGIPEYLREQWEKPLLLFKLLSFQGVDLDGRGF